MFSRDFYERTMIDNGIIGNNLTISLTAGWKGLRKLPCDIVQFLLEDLNFEKWANMYYSFKLFTTTTYLILEETRR